MARGRTVRSTRRNVPTRRISNLRSRLKRARAQTRGRSGGMGSPRSIPVPPARAGMGVRRPIGRSNR